jgi:CheR methyltransferase, SAM binding domain/CheB methylesterase
MLTAGPSSVRVVGIGASTGGLSALKAILGPLPGDFPVALLVAGAPHPGPNVAGACRQRRGLHHLPGPTSVGGRGPLQHDPDQHHRLRSRPEAWKALGEHVIARLLTTAESTGTVRVWSAGCSTGEEAYSVGDHARRGARRAPLLRRREDLRHRLDEEALTVARHGLYRLERPVAHLPAMEVKGTRYPPDPGSAGHRRARRAVHRARAGSAVGAAAGGTEGRSGPARGRRRPCAHRRLAPSP